jgi:hypothetical protein
MWTPQFCKECGKRLRFKNGRGYCTKHLYLKNRPSLKAKFCPTCGERLLPTNQSGYCKKHWHSSKAGLQNRKAANEKRRRAALQVKVFKAKSFLAAQPQPGRSSGGRPKGMMDVTRQEAQQLERFIGEFEKQRGTRKGALQYACKRVYPRSDDPLKAVRRASKTLAKYRKQRKNKTP